MLGWRGREWRGGGTTGGARGEGRRDALFFVFLYFFLFWGWGGCFLSDEKRDGELLPVEFVGIGCGGGEEVGSLFLSGKNIEDRFFRLVELLGWGMSFLSDTQKKKEKRKKKRNRACSLYSTKMKKIDRWKEKKSNVEQPRQNKQADIFSRVESKLPLLFFQIINCLALSPHSGQGYDK